MCVVFSCSKKNDKNYFFCKFQYSSKCNSEDHRLKRFLSCKTTSVIVRLPKRLSFLRDNSMIFNMQINQKYSNFSIFLGDFLTISADNNQQRLLDVTGFRSIKEEACNFIKKRHWHRCFHPNFVKFLRASFYRAPLVVASAIILILFLMVTPDLFFGKGIVKICSKVTGEHPCKSVI